MQDSKVHNRLKAKRLFLDLPAGRNTTARQKLDRAACRSRGALQYLDEIKQGLIPEAMQAPL